MQYPEMAAHASVEIMGCPFENPRGPGLRSKHHDLSQQGNDGQTVGSVQFRAVPRFYGFSNLTVGTGFIEVAGNIYLVTGGKLIQEFMKH